MASGGQSAQKDQHQAGKIGSSKTTRSVQATSTTPQIPDHHSPTPYYNAYGPVTVGQYCFTNRHHNGEDSHVIYNPYQAITTWLRDPNGLMIPNEGRHAERVAKIEQCLADFDRAMEKEVSNKERISSLSKTSKDESSFATEG